MRRMSLALSLMMLATDAWAISRYDIGKMSCQQVQSIVQREGAAILRYRSKRNPSLTLYDRYVRDTRFCSGGEYAMSSTVPVAGGKSCRVRKCEEIDPFFDD